MSKKTKTKNKRGKAKKQRLVKITSPVKKDAAFFVASELADDRLIGQELLGQTVKTLIYEYEDEAGETIRGLSYQGTREAVRVINRDRASGHTIQISDKSPSIEEKTVNGQDGVEVMVYAQDIESGGGSWGLKFEPYQKHIHDGKGSTVFNRFARETALSKAQRNAMFNLLPAALIEKVIEKFAKETGAVEKIEAPKTEARVVVPKATGKEKLYRVTLNRVEHIKGKKKELEEALKNVDSMPISGEQRGNIRRKISTYLKKL